MYFDFAPPADMETEDFNFQIELTLADTNRYAAETEASFNVQYRQKEVVITEVVKKQTAQEVAPPFLIFEDIDFEDNLSISFTEEMEYPNGIEYFRADNLGAEYFWISYEPSESTDDFIYNREVNRTNTMSWSILDV